eukprot:1062421-Pyramimonas_sp.AAC.1
MIQRGKSVSCTKSTTSMRTWTDTTLRTRATLTAVTTASWRTSAHSNGNTRLNNVKGALRHGTQYAGVQWRKHRL